MKTNSLETERHLVAAKTQSKEIRVLPHPQLSEAEAPILWPPDAKSPLIGKDPDAGEDWRQKEKEVTEDEMVR